MMAKVDASLFMQAMAVRATRSAVRSLDCNSWIWRVHFLLGMIRLLAQRANLRDRVGLIHVVEVLLDRPALRVIFGGDVSLHLDFPIPKHVFQERQSSGVLVGVFRDYGRTTGP